MCSLAKARMSLRVGLHARAAAPRRRRPSHPSSGRARRARRPRTPRGAATSTFSTSTQYTFSPPRLIMSFRRSTIWTKPSSSMRARSPVCNQPSTNVSADLLRLVPVTGDDVLAADQQFADAVAGSGSSRSTSTGGAAKPTVSGRSSAYSSGRHVDTDEVSVSPKPLARRAFGNELRRRRSRQVPSARRRR